MSQAQVQVPGIAPGGAGAGPGPATERGPARGRVVVLNALPLNALPRRPLHLTVEPITNIVSLAMWLSHMVRQGYEIVHFIRHPATVQLLRGLGAPIPEAPNTELYRWREGDIVVVVTLRQPQRGAEVQALNLGDLEAWEVRIQPIA